MSENNSFLSGYNKKDDNQKEKVEVKDVLKSSLKYEEKSSFKKPEKNSGIPPAGSNNRSKMITWIIVGAVIVIALALTLLLLLGGGKVEMQDFTGWTQSDMQLWANENKVLLQMEKDFSDVVDEGKVISQDPAPGTKIKKGNFLALSVSLGHDLSITLALPDLMSMSKAQIEAWAQENFMTKVRFTVEYSDDIASGTVIRFEVNDNTVLDEVRRDTPVYIIISKGPEDETAIEITVPDFKTMLLSECFVFANENGLVLKVEEMYDDYVPKGAIISQSAKAESKVKKGDEITLAVSKGKMIIVPDFSEYSKENAMSAASELGIAVSIIERYSSASAGEFISQSIDPGSLYLDGDYLELCYSFGNKIVLSSFVGQTRDTIEVWAKELNELGARITIKATYTKNNTPAGTIIQQDIANKLISRTCTINITVSSGKVIFVPDFVVEEGSGYDVVVTRQKALEMCESLGIVPIFVESANAARLPGEIWEQSIAAGSEVNEGDTITLKFVPTQKTAVPNFAGMTKEEVTAGGYDQLFDIDFVQSEDVVAGFGGKIYDQSLFAGTTVVKGSTITLIISAEPEPEPSPTPTATP